MSAGELGLATGDRGLLYQEGLRSMLGPVLPPWTLAGDETAAAMRSVRHASGTSGCGAEGDRGSDGTLPLYPLRQHRDGLTLAELCTRMPEEYARLSPVLEKLERTGELVRWRGDDGTIRLRLTEGGRRAMDEHMRERAADSLILVEDVPAERVAIVRHVCVQAVLNSERLDGGDGAERDEVAPGEILFDDDGSPPAVRLPPA